MKLVNKIAGLLNAIENCAKTGNGAWTDIHRETIEKLIKEYMPSGSGFDSENPVTLDFDKSKPERLIFKCSYHPLNQDGYYDSWMYFRLKVTPSLVFEYKLQVMGLNQPKEALHKEYFIDLFSEILNGEVK